MNELWLITILDASRVKGFFYKGVVREDPVSRSPAAYLACLEFRRVYRRQRRVGVHGR